MSYTATPAGAPTPSLATAGAANGRTPRRSLVGRAVRVVLVLAVIAIVGRLLFAVDAPTDVLQLPDEGAVRAARLTDGTPVYLVHQADGSATVVEAVSPSGPGPVGSLVGWCPIAEQFVDPHLGRMYDARGQRSTVSIPGRAVDELTDANPDPREDLRRRSFERLEGRDGAEDPLLVGPPLTPSEIAADPLDRPEDARMAAPPPGCQVAPNPVAPNDDAFALAARNRLLDHGFQTALLRVPRSGWQITDGYLLVDGEGRATWCRVEPVGAPPTCPDAAPISIDLPITAAGAGGAWTVIGGPLAARSANGAVVEVAVLPRSVWRGGSLQGTTSYVGGFAGLDLTRDTMRLEPFPRGAGVECLREATLSPGLNGTPAGIQFVNGDTEWDVDGQTDPVALADRPPTTPIEVEVLVDAATCQALRVTST